jgi:hypothetical protein
MNPVRSRGRSLGNIEENVFVLIKIIFARPRSLYDRDLLLTG